MYQLNLTEEEYKILEEMVCTSYNQLTDKARIADIGRMLKETIPPPADLANEIDTQLSNFDRRYNIVSAIHDRIHDLEPIQLVPKEAQNIKKDNHTPGLATDTDNTFISHSAPIMAENISVPHPALDAGSIAKDPEYVLHLYGTDKRKLTEVFGMLSSYHTTLNLTMRDDKNHDTNSRNIREARDYIWTLIESMK